MDTRNSHFTQVGGSAVLVGSCLLVLHPLIKFWTLDALEEHAIGYFPLVAGLLGAGFCRPSREGAAKPSIERRAQAARRLAVGLWLAVIAHCAGVVAWFLGTGATHTTWDLVSQVHTTLLATWFVSGFVMFEAMVGLGTPPDGDAGEAR